MEFLWVLAKRSATVLVVSISLADTVGSIARTHGDSMQPTLNPGSRGLSGIINGDVVFVEKLSAPSFKFSRGDVVVLR